MTYEEAREKSELLKKEIQQKLILGILECQYTASYSGELTVHHALSEDDLESKIHDEIDGDYEIDYTLRCRECGDFVDLGHNCISDEDEDDYDDEEVTESECQLDLFPTP